MLKIQGNEAKNMSFKEFLANLPIDSWFVVEMSDRPWLYKLQKKNSEGGYKLLTYSVMSVFQDCAVRTNNDVLAWSIAIKKFYQVSVVDVIVKQVGPTFHN